MDQYKWLVTDGAPSLPTQVAFIQHFGGRLSNPIQQTIAHRLSSENTGLRFMGASQLLMRLGKGIDTPKAHKLGKIVLQLIPTYWPSLAPTLQPNATAILASVLFNWIYASIQEGQSSNLIKLWRDWGRFIPELNDDPHYWNARCHIALAELRRNHVHIVEEFLSSCPPALAPHLSHLPLLKDRYTAFTQGRFQLDEKRPNAEQAQKIWEEALTQIHETVSAAELQSKTKPLEDLDWDSSKLPWLLAELESQLAYIKTNVPFDEKYRQMSQRTLIWKQAYKEFLNPGYDPNYVNAQWVEDCLYKVSLIQSDVFHGEELLQYSATSLTELSRALRWAKRADDQHSLWMIRWAAATVYEKCQNSARRIQSLQRLCRSLGAKRLSTDDPNVCSQVAHFFSGLAEKVSRLPDSLEHPEVMMEAFELRRGRALTAARADLTLKNNHRWGQLEPLGASTHYLGYTVFDERHEIFAQLVTADGQISIHPIPLNWTALQQALDTLEPSQRETRSRFSIQRLPFWQSLLSLTTPLEEALQHGRIAQGDHLCIAADDPIHLLPLHALTCEGQLLFRLFTCSRVSSFSDAEILAFESFTRPSQATTILVDAQHKDPTLRRGHWYQTVCALSDLGLSVEPIAPPYLDADGLLAHFVAKRVIHIHAHGHFPHGQNPQTHGGIVVSDGHGPPILDGCRSRLLTPQAILEATPDLSGSHLSLNTCVGGKGLPGKYGDTLGLEMAMRWSEASSVLAAHWNVDSKDATLFFDHFYRAWLGEGMSRAKAWQAALISLTDPDVPISNQIRWCAFSLFGGWT